MKTSASEKPRANMSDAEWQTRLNLAAAFRMGHQYGWNDNLGNHISARVPDAPDQFLMNAHGYGWNEITASSLVKADFNGNILSHAPGEVFLQPAGYNFHSGILKARPDLASVIHVHAMAGVVISATKSGLKVVDQAGCYLLGEVGYHNFEGFAQEEDEVPRMLADLGDKLTLIMWNHGLLSVGQTLGVAFSFMGRLITACTIQERLMATGAEIREIPQEVKDVTEREIRKRRQDKSRSDREWQMHFRTAQSLFPDFQN